MDVKTKNFKPHFSTATEYAVYLSECLIPDMIENGSTALAVDLMEAHHWIEKLRLKVEEGRI